MIVITYLVIIDVYQSGNFISSTTFEISVPKETTMERNFLSKQIQKEIDDLKSYYRLHSFKIANVIKL